MNFFTNKTHEEHLKQIWRAMHGEDLHGTRETESVHASISSAPSACDECLEAQAQGAEWGYGHPFCEEASKNHLEKWRLGLITNLLQDNVWRFEA